MTIYGQMDEHGRVVVDPDYIHLAPKMKGAVRIVQEGKDKERMYAYYHAVLIEAGMNHFRELGEQVDEGETDIIFKMKFAKKEIRNPMTNEEHYVPMDKRDMTRARLKQFISDVQFWLESMGVKLPENISRKQ